MTETQVNIPLLRKAVEWAEAEAAKPETECEWFQAYYVATPADRARFIAYRRLGTIMSEEAEALASQLEPECGTCYCVAGWITTQAGIEDPDDYEEEACRLLGLDDYDDAARLFSDGNTIADVRRIAEEIAGEKL